MEYLTLDEIRRDGGTQPRAAISLQHVKLLEEQMADGQQLEAITVFYDGESYWLADGFHRWHAHRNREEEVIACVIYQGSRRDAVLYSVGAKADHKPVLPRSREDKHHAVLMLIQDPEWGTWSDREIAKQCKVSQPFVSKLRLELTDNIHNDNSPLTDNVISEKSTPTYKTKHGTVAKMNTAKIGKSRKKAALPSEEINSVSGQIPLYCRVRVKDDHPLFSGQSGIITQLSNPDAAIVELMDGTSELIQLKDLDVFGSDQIQIAHHLRLVQGALVEIHLPTNNKINGRLGRIAAIHENTVEVWLRDVNTMTMHKHTLIEHRHLSLLYSVE